MIGADPIERVNRTIARDADMSHFGMARSVDWATINDCAPSDACADCDVDQAIETAPAPQRCSPSAAAFTSVSNTTGNFNFACIGPTTSAFRQPGLGVVVMYPYVGETVRRSSGPNEPMPTAVRGVAR